VSIIVVESSGGFLAQCDATITVYDRVDRTYSEQVCAWAVTAPGEETALRLGERHDEAHAMTTETIKRVREAGPIRPHPHIHGPQCTRESCPTVDVYFHAGQGCPPTGARVCGGHALPSRAELTAASKKKRGG
jgi:hypothetical protein